MAKSWTTATKTIILLLFLQVPGDLQISLPHRWQAPWRSGSSVDGEMNVRKTCHIYWYLGLFKVMFYFKPMENPWKSTTWLIRESIGNSFSCFGVPWANQSSISVIENGVHLPTVIFYRENCDSLVNHWTFHSAQARSMFQLPMLCWCESRSTRATFWSSYPASEKSCWLPSRVRKNGAQHTVELMSRCPGVHKVPKLVFHGHWV